MKKVYRHAPPKKAAPKPRKKRAATVSEEIEKSNEALYSHPIFHTRYAGIPIKYIRPFEPVWPTDPEN